MRTKKWRQLIKGLFAILILFPFLSGCWDRLEIEDRAIILGIAIDRVGNTAQRKEEDVTHTGNAFKAPSKYLIRLTAQIGIPGRLSLGPQMGGGGSGQKPVWVVSVVGHTIDDAMKNLQQQLANQIFLGHLRVIVVNKTIARKGLKNISDFLRRNSDVRRTAWLLVAQDAAHVMSVSPEMERIPTLYLTSTMDQAVDMGKLPPSFLGVFWRTSSSKGQNSFLPYITVPKEGNIEISGMACFKNGKMIGMITPLQIGFYMGIKGLNPGGYAGFVPVSKAQGKVLLETQHRRSKIEMSIQNGRPHATIKIRLEVELNEKSNPRFTVDRSSTLRKIEHINNHQLNIAYEELIKDTQKIGTDIFGFGKFVRAKHPEYWEKHIQTKEKWNKIYQDMTVEVHTRVKIRRVGVKAK
ncbi:MAG TPA: Ger(x)C family spore germination protein [Bacillales bacterium]